MENETNKHKKKYYNSNKKRYNRNNDTSQEKTFRKKLYKQYDNNTEHNFIEQVSSKPFVVFAQCFYCGTGISNESYAIKMDEEHYLHFECVLKKVKEIAQQKLNYGNQMKYTYIGSNTFAVYLKQGGSNYSWKILQKIKLEEILPLLKADKVN